MSSIRILVADDDQTTCLLMQAALVKAGLAVELAHDGEAALAAFERAPFDMVMLDVDMPRMNGFAACAALRQRWGAAGEPLATRLQDLGQWRYARHGQRGALRPLLRQARQALRRLPPS